MEIQYVVGLVILLIVLALVFPSTLNAFEKIYSSPYFKPEYKDFTSKSQVEGQFDTFVKNFNACKSIPKSGCMCSNVFPGFPNVFPKEFSLKMDITQQGETAVSLIYLGKEEVKKSTIQNVFFLPMSMAGQNKVKEESVKISYLITFKDGNAYLEGTKLLSSGIYKLTSSRIGALIYSSWIGIINWASPMPSESNQLNYLSLLPKC